MPLEPLWVSTYVHLHHRRKNSNADTHENNFSHFFTTIVRASVCWSTSFIILYSILHACDCMYLTQASSVSTHVLLLVSISLIFTFDVFYSILFFSTLLYFTLLYSTLLYSTQLYSTQLLSILHYTAQFHSTLLNSTLLYSSLFYTTLLNSTQLCCMLCYTTLFCSTLFHFVSIRIIKS